MTPDKLVELAGSRIPDGPLVVALSGGPDSAAAAWLALHVRAATEVDLVHVHHGWPGSAVMEEAARAIAAELRRPLHVVGVDAGRTETEARPRRIEALVSVADGRPIVTGHHRDDDIETVLGNLLRGAGATGLSGISELRRPFHRPLLHVGRADLRAVVESLGLPFRDDPANQDDMHRRNRLRNQTLPALETAEPGFSVRLLRSSASLAEDDAVLERAAAAVPIHRDDDGVVYLPYGAMRTAAPAVTARLIRRALRLAHPPYAGTTSDVTAIRGLGTGGSVAIGDGIDAVRDGPFVALVPHDVAPPAPAPLELPIPGSVEFGCHRISCRPVAGPAPIVVGRTSAVVAGDGGFTVRAPEAGDRVDIGGGSKLVSDALSEARIPLRRRKRWPVVVSRGRIVWIAGVRVAHPAAQGAGSGEPIRLVVERL